MGVNFISAATPAKIQLIMNVNSIGRKQISAHLQVHNHIVLVRIIMKSHNMNYKKLIMQQMILPETPEEGREGTT
jgi:hypothetical protein